MYQQDFDPLSGSLALSAAVASLPLLTIFVLLGVFRIKAHIAALSALAVAIGVAVIAYGMPSGQAALAATEGATFGFFPILWIVINAIWIYTLTLKSGHFDILRRSFGSVSDDPRIQAIIIAFCFGALLEALAGFGAPVAITGVMLIALGFRPLKAATVVLVANTAPVAFGALAIPILTAGKLTGIPPDEIGAITGRQTPVLALFVPLLIVYLVDGRRGLREAKVPALVCGVAFALAQFACSNYGSIELTDIVAALVAVVAVIALLRFWRPSGASPEEVLGDGAAPAAGRDDIPETGATPETSPAAAVVTSEPVTDSRLDITRAYAPYGIIITIFALAQINVIEDWLAKATRTFSWPGLDVLNPKGEAVGATTFTLNFASAAGSLLLLAGVLSMIVLRISPRVMVRAYGETLHQLRWAIVTVASVLALAYVMNLSGQTTTLGLWIAGAGGLFAFLSPLLGWIGVAVTGSDTSSNALFASLQVAAAKEAGISPELLAAANTSGGVLGKMVSTQTLVIACAATGLEGEEGTLLRRVIGYSLAMLLGLCVLVYLQSTFVLSWMI